MPELSASEILEWTIPLARRAGRTNDFFAPRAPPAATAA